MNVSRPILITGVTGQIGSALLALLYEDAVGVSREECDLARPVALMDFLDKMRPSAVINAAAYTAVDKAEEEEALATVINGEAPGVMAGWCARAGIPFVHYSTDYVFDGSGEHYHTEEEAVSPRNAYGRSKRAGEEAVLAAGGEHLIFRTSWVYDAHGKNFFNTMLRLGRDRKELRVVADQYGAPSYAPHLAAATVEALEKARAMPVFPSSIIHLCNSGITNWHHFAEAVFEGARRYGEELAVERVVPITTADYPTPAARPLNSRLDMTRLQRLFSITMPDWREGLEACLAAKY